MSEPLIVTTAPREGHQLEITIELGPERTQKALHRGARLVAQKARIPGFRPGKAPDATVLRMFGRDAVLAEVLDDLGEEVYREVLETQGIQAYGRAELTDVKTEPVTFKLTVPLRPSVDLGDYSDLRLEAPPVEVSEADVEAVLERELEARSTLQAVDRPAAIGDTVTVDIRGTVGEVEIMNNRDWKLLLKEESGWLPGFDASFVGLSAGEQKTFTLTYPETSASRFKGQQATFEATVKAVEAKVRPPLDDEFARSLGNYEGLADLRAKLLQQLTEQRTAQARERLNQQAIEALIERATIVYPAQAVEDTLDEIVRDTEFRVKEAGYTLEDYLRLQGTTLEQYREQMRPVAEKRLKGRLVLQELARREGITVSSDETEWELARMLGEAPQEEQADSIRKIFRSEAGRFVISQDLLTDKTLARLRAIVTGQVAAAPLEAKDAAVTEIPVAEAAAGAEPPADVEAAPASPEPVASEAEA